jgi:predicted transcriptional regulator
MTVKYNIGLSDQLNAEIDEVVQRTENTKAEVIRKALSLYLAAEKGKQEGLTVGLVDKSTKELRTEIVGL